MAPHNSPKEGPWLDFCTTLAKEEDAEWLAAELTKRGYRTPPNTGRFNFCGTLAKEDAEWLKAELTKRGYLK